MGDQDACGNTVEYMGRNWSCGLPLNHNDNDDGKIETACVQRQASYGNWGFCAYDKCWNQKVAATRATILVHKPQYYWDHAVTLQGIIPRPEVTPDHNNRIFIHYFCYFESLRRAQPDLPHGDRLPALCCYQAAKCTKLFFGPPVATEYDSLRRFGWQLGVPGSVILADFCPFCAERLPY